MRHPLSIAASALALLLTGIALGAAARGPAVEAFTPQGFIVEHEVFVDASPADAFDAFTGDVLPWWDHHFSKEPKTLEIQPRPGGFFLEVFDDEGNGAVHAHVIGVHRGREIQFVGPLGFASQNVNLRMTHRVRFDEKNGRTRVRIDVHGVGEAGPAIEEMVQGVWKHFLSDRFAPYVNGTLDD
ncbi:MAG: SRPBCC domain-containing protein [Planctomycetota bacterium]